MNIEFSSPKHRESFENFLQRDGLLMKLLWDTNPGGAVKNAVDVFRKLPMNAQAFYWIEWIRHLGISVNLYASEFNESWNLLTNVGGHEGEFPEILQYVVIKIEKQIKFGE